MTEFDQEKTFESVDWNFLPKALQHFGHGSEIILKKKLVYQNIETQMKVNGHLPQASLVKRGLRQGRPLYVILYVVLTVNIFRGYKTKQFHQRYCNRRKGTENFCFC